MAQLVGLIVTNDDTFRKHIARMLRAGSVGVMDEAARSAGTSPDIVVVDIRADASAGMTTIERMRASAPSAGVFAVAAAAEPDLILQSMRSGANEFFVFPPTDEVFSSAIRRSAARRETTHGARQAATSLVFFGAKGGAGTTTLAVNCAVDLARIGRKQTLILDLKPGLGEVGLFLGVKPRYSVLDAIDNLHRLDRQFLRELVIKHKSGLEILAGSDHFDRPSGNDSSAIEELVRLISREYEYLVVDAGSQINSCTVAALYASDRIFLVANPDVPSLRNAQRLLDKVKELGASGERVRFLLNRAAEPYPIPPKQIEAALGHPIHHMFPSDYKTVSSALNSGVPLAMAGNSELANQFDEFTRQIFDPNSEPEAQAAPKRSMLGLEKIASIW